MARPEILVVVIGAIMAVAVIFFGVSNFGMLTSPEEAAVLTPSNLYCTTYGWQRA